MQVSTRLALTVAFVVTTIAIDIALISPDQLHESKEPPSLPPPASSSGLHSPSPSPTHASQDGSEATLTSITAFGTVVSTIFIPDDRPQLSTTLKEVETDSSATLSPTATATATPTAFEAPGAENGQTNRKDAWLGNQTSPPPWDVNPSILPDVPVTAAFSVLFLLGACLNGWRIYDNNKADRENLGQTFSSVMVVFCVLRVTTCVLRIVNATGQHGIVFMLAEMISLEIGSAIILLVSVMLAQRLIRQSCLATPLHSRWRLAVFWLSRLLVSTALLFAMGIVLIYGLGANLFIASRAANDTSDAFDSGLSLLRISIIFLLALGAFPMILVFLVVVTAHKAPGLRQDLGVKLAVFFSGLAAPLAGQGSHLVAFFGTEIPGAGKVVFYVAGFTLETLVVLLYAWANLDFLFGAGDMNSLAPVDETGCRNERGSPCGDGNSWAQDDGGEKGTDVRGIVVRKALGVSVSRAGTRRDERAPSVASFTSDRSSVYSQVSELNFSGPPEPAWPLPARQVLDDGDKMDEGKLGSGSQGRPVRAAPSLTSWKKSHPYVPQAHTPPLSPYEPVAKGNKRKSMLYLQ